MPAHHSAHTKQKQKPQANQPPINTLPSEILSKIFIICDRLWSSDIGKFPCQETIPLVCRQWRRVALGAPAFWARVTVSDSTSYDRAALHLSRSGKKVPLDIEFDQVQAYWSDWEEGALYEFARQAKRRSKFLVKQGGVPSRWQRLLIQTDIFFVQLVALDFLRSTRLPALEYLEIRWYGPSDLEDEDYDKLAEASHPLETPSLLFHDQLPPLHTVKLAGVPNPRLFGHEAHPQLVGLTRLEIDFLECHPNLADIHKMLAANSKLVVLILTTESIAEEYPHDDSEVPSKSLSKIHFPELRALSFSGVTSSEWDLGVLATINAPNLNVLRIKSTGSPHYDEHFQSMLDLIARGEHKEAPRSYLPALTHLCYNVPGDRTEELRGLLVAYPNVTSISVTGDHPLGVLLDEPWLAPGLARLRVISLVSLDALKRVVIARDRAGIRLKTVELTTRNLKEGSDGEQPQDIRGLEAWVDMVVVSEKDDEFARVDPTSW